MMNDEAIIEQRLLIDADDLGDDKRLNVLLREFIQWCQTEDEEPQKNHIYFNRLVAQLTTCKFDIIKSHHVAQMIEEEMENYSALAHDLDKTIKDIDNEIKISQEQLLVAQNVRTNRMERNLMVSMIMKEPDRKESLKKIEKLKKRLADLNKENSKLDEEIHQRCNDFHVFTHALYELQDRLEEDTSDNDEINEPVILMDIPNELRDGENDEDDEEEKGENVNIDSIKSDDQNEKATLEEKEDSSDINDDILMDMEQLSPIDISDDKLENIDLESCCDLDDVEDYWKSEEEDESDVDISDLDMMSIDETCVNVYIEGIPDEERISAGSGSITT